MLEQLRGLHIEPTNMCTLRCPRCSRTKFLEQFGSGPWENQNLNLVHLQNFLDIDLTDKKIILCGNYGDPIYYPDLLEMVSWFKSQRANITLVTNGSYRKAAWWQQLAELMTDSDQINFSVDGSPENFTQYRVNADWASIQTGMKIMSQSACKTVWKYIPFSFNEHNIPQAQDLAAQLGIDEFRITPSDRWDGAADPLKPVTFTGNRETAKMIWLDNKAQAVSAKCKISHNEHFITATGYYTPCCYSADHRFYYRSVFYKQRDQFDISKTRLSNVLLNLSEFYHTIADAGYDYCTFNCPKI